MRYRQQIEESCSKLSEIITNLKDSFENGKTISPNVLKGLIAAAEYYSDRINELIALQPTNEFE